MSYKEVKIFFVKCYVTLKTTDPITIFYFYVNICIVGI
jgi:hypothetical protein